MLRAEGRKKEKVLGIAFCLAHPGLRKALLPAVFNQVGSESPSDNIPAFRRAYF
jgi:hypothetical protein